MYGAPACLLRHRPTDRRRADGRGSIGALSVLLRDGQLSVGRRLGDLETCTRNCLVTENYYCRRCEIQYQMPFKMLIPTPGSLSHLAKQGALSCPQWTAPDGQSSLPDHSRRRLRACRPSRPCPPRHANAGHRQRLPRWRVIVPAASTGSASGCALGCDQRDGHHHWHDGGAVARGRRSEAICAGSPLR